MKKGIILTAVVGSFFALALVSCGEKFTPLTEDQLAAQADSIFTAQKDAKVEELRAACQSSLETQVNMKVEVMKNAETASN